MTVPAIKATLFQLTADRIEELLGSGRLTRAELERRLLPEDLEYLGKQLAASSWVPVATLARVAQVAIEAQYGDSSEAQLRAEGARGAMLIHRMGLYKQFDATAERWGANLGRIVLTFASVAYNFTRWSLEPGATRDSARIVVDDARDFPEFSRIATEGFMAYMWSAAAKSDIEVTSERPSPDRVVFTIRAKGA